MRIALSTKPNQRRCRLTVDVRSRRRDDNVRPPDALVEARGLWYDTTRVKNSCARDRDRTQRLPVVGKALIAEPSSIRAVID
ncbi:hypothetical protein EVAR_38370_1 [Eumeta japonica]|uniref:Uncharacterized protein n=1 Tax=Eumeta variegata TaxID=151549 RepID=A0A4C1XZB3_EUMVA|nr:hypothetical protein EVAR_38370_1 [Eumeta japonica]